MFHISSNFPLNQLSNDGCCPPTSTRRMVCCNHSLIFNYWTIITIFYFKLNMLYIKPI